MIKEEQDEKEFEKAWFEFRLGWPFSHVDKTDCRYFFMASRRLLREKGMEKKKLLGDNEDREWMHLHNIK